MPNWIGGGNNSASNPSDWSGGAPVAGEGLTMVSHAPYTTSPEVMNISGAALHGDPLFIQYGPGVAINMSNAAQLVATDRMSTAVFDLSGNSQLTLAAVQCASVTINVAGTDTVHLTMSKGLTTVNIGRGSHLNGTLEVQAGKLVMAQPLQSSAADVLVGGEIDLKGLVATAYSFANDLLTFYNGKTVVDRVSLENKTAHGFAVVHGSGSVNIVALASTGQTMAGSLTHLAH